MGDLFKTRKIVNDFVEFSDNLKNLEGDALYYYWMTEAILKAAEAIKGVEEKEQ